jgi:transposase
LVTANDEQLWRRGQALCAAYLNIKNRELQLLMRSSIIEATGATVIHLPAYSPDFNPIEECISKIKETLRSLKARTKRKLYNALKKAIAMVTADDIQGWFKHCGYVSSLN